MKKWRFKRVLLCVPPFPGIYEYPSAPLPATGYLESMLEKNKVVVDVIDMRLNYTIKNLLKKVEEFKPDLIGMTMMTYRHDVAYELVNQLKKAGHTVVIGGPHVSTLRKKVLEECDADFAVKIEGEYPLLELCMGMDLKKIKGLIFRNNGEIIENEDRPPILELDKIPIPHYKHFELEKYKTKSIQIITSRGCPFFCIYCPVKVTMGRQFRVRSPENVVNEIKYWYKKGYRRFAFNDDNFTLFKKRVLEICDLIEKNNLKDLILGCPNGIRADKTDREVLKRMKEVGFRNFGIGVEAGTNRILKILKKGQTIEVVEKAIKNACDLGFDINLFFLIGSPGETLPDVKKSVNLALKYPISDVRFYNLIPFPETELYDWIEKNNYFLKDPKDYLNQIMQWENEPVFWTPEFSKDERREALIFTKYIREIVLLRALKRKFRKRYGILGIVMYSFLRLKITKRIIFISFKHLDRTWIFRKVRQKLSRSKMTAVQQLLRYIKARDTC